MKPVCTQFDLMLDAVNKYWRTDIWSCCDLQFENRQRHCSWTVCLSSSAASNWMQFRICNVCLALLLRIGCSSEYAILIPRLAITWTSILTLKIDSNFSSSKVAMRQLQLTSIEVALSQRKVTVENFSLFTLRQKVFELRMISVSQGWPTDSHFFTVSCWLRPSLAITNLESTCVQPRPSDPRWMFGLGFRTRSEHEFWHLAPSSCIRSLLAQALELEFRPPDHLWEP